MAVGRSVAALLLNAFLWGVSWWPFRWLAERGLHGLWATAIVYALIAGLIVAARPRSARILASSRALWPLVLAAGLTNACFNWAVTIGDVIRVVLLFYLMPVWSMLFARWLLGEPLRVASVLRLVLAIAGAAVVLVPPDAGWPVPRALPDWLAVAGGASFALTNVLLRRDAASPGDARALAMFVGGVVVAGPLGTALAIAGTIAAPPAAAGALALAPGLGLLALMFLAGNLALQYGAARLPAHVTAVVMLSEVAFAAASAIALGGERLTTGLVAGATLILAAAAWAAVDPGGREAGRSGSVRSVGARCR